MTEKITETEVELSNAQAPETLSWDINFGREQPGKRTVVLLAATVAAVGAVIFFNNLLLALFAFGAVIGLTLELFVPARYQLTASEVQARVGWSVTALEWSRVRRVIDLGDAVRLSPLAKASRLDEFRGVLLRFNGNRDEVFARINEFRQHDQRTVRS